MASAKSYMLFLSVFSLAFALEAAQSRQSNMRADASLGHSTETVSSLLSPNGRFAFGFYPEGTGFSVGIWLEGSSGNITVIWTANRDDPPVAKDAVLKLTIQGLKLDERLVSQISTGTHASSASMLDSGNFVIYDSEFNVIWESFDHPTDTIIAGQVLHSGYGLVSSKSETDHSSGRFVLAMQGDGNLVMYPEESPRHQEDAYWASGTYEQSYDSLHLDDNGWLYMVGVNLTYNLTSGYRRKTTAVYRATLSVDGIFQLHWHDFESNDETVVAEVPSLSDHCQVNGICGVNSYCNSTNGTAAVCLCLPGFVYLYPNNTFNGCTRNFTIPACDFGNDNTTYMSDLENVTWTDDPYTAGMSAKSKDDCSEACRKDCNCYAALFHQGNTCSKQKFPLRYGSRDSSSTTFIKQVNISAKGRPLTSPASCAAVPVKKEHSANILIVPVAVIAGIASTLAVLILFAYRRQAGRYRRRMGRNKEPDLVDEIAPRSFSYRELREATDDFKDEIGKGAFGTVFKGTMSGSGEKAFAVKRLDRLVDEGGERDFLTEMRAIGRTHHRNLVRLLGFCEEGSNRLLVYEYMSNGSLAGLIFKTERRPPWVERVRIALDVAKGIHYLHEECDMRIIHCDIKPQNILMDGNWTAKLSDFGLAKLLTPSETRTFTRNRGTREYLAPEWHKNALISVKADVYSFGIVLLETVCCRKYLDFEVEVDAICLLEWVYKCLLAGELEKLISDEVDTRELSRLVKVGLWCTQSEPASRPAMKNVVMMLEGNIDVSLPPPPACNF